MEAQTLVASLLINPFLDSVAEDGGNLAPVPTTGGTPATDWLRNALNRFLE